LTPLDEQQQQLVATMETETLRLSRLVNDLRTLAELETEPLNLQPVALDAFVAAIVQLEQERFEAGQRIFTTHVDDHTATWLVDEDLLALAVHNLLDNAYKYTRPGDHIRLEVEAGQELLVRVTDTGVGIPADVMPHVWDELYRAAQEEKIPGSGIGLALVRAIVERHEGTVEIASKRSVDGTHGEAKAGTSVTLRIPLLA
jgi:two-component system OmpR family sensor kinase